ncbi:MAG TPA: ABC transporter ATP-binding protein [Firmicutes bacterium]|nr:ABC transporter ATP-binding protein [Bacillota bacterium]
MDHFQEEQTLGKAYDGRLMRRLLKYAKPYWALITLCVVLLLVIAVTDLARPYLVKVAIDDHILGSDMSYVHIAEVMDDEELITIQGYSLRREKGVVDEPDQSGRLRFELVRKEGQQFLQSTEGDVVLTLSPEDIRELRRVDRVAILRLGVLLLIVVSVGFALNYIQAYLLQFTGQRIVFDIRQAVFKHLESMALSFFDRNPVGRLVTRVTNDTQNLHEMYTAVLVNLFKDIFMILGIIVVMFRLDVRLAWVSMATLPLIVVITAIFRIKARAAYRETRVRLARINATFAENIAGMRLVQIFRQERRKFKEFDDVNRSHYRASMQELKVFAIFRPSIELVYSLAVAILIWVGGGQLLRGIVDFGVLYAFVNYLELFFRPINDLTEKYNIMQASMASAERIFLILDEPPAIKEIDNPKPMGEVKGHIEFRNVWFAYVGEDWVLRDVSFTVEPGETVAFVGATGAGKSTIMNLLSRFYDIQKGQILIDGQDIKELSLAELRRNVGLVMQDVFMFSGTIGENIRLNNPEIGMERVESVARYVNAHHFIEALPKQYEDPVTERGSTLSSGQRQLIAFARALAYDPAILILDEATASIDTETEALIQDALPKLLTGRTSLVVAHRLSTIQDADTIIVLHRGKIREQGTHQELLAQKGLYYNLFLLQYKDDFGDAEGVS